MHVGLEAVWQALLFAGRYFDSILLRGQISDNTSPRWIEVWCPEAASNELDSDWFGFLIAEGNDRIGRLAIDKLDAKDLCVRERCRYLDSERRRGRGSFNFFLKYLLAL